MDQMTVSLTDIKIQLKNMLPMLHEKYHVHSLAVFGSYLRGEAQEDSDLDLLVSFTETPSLFQFVALENCLSDVLNVKVDLVMKESLKPYIGKRILAEAQPV